MLEDMKTPSTSTQSPKPSQNELASVETKVNEEVGMEGEGEEFINREESERNEEDGVEVRGDRITIRDNNGEMGEEKEEGVAEEGEGEQVVDEESDVKPMQQSSSSHRKPRISRVWTSHSSSSLTKGKK